jgi:CheY-like chemotaxis protein
MSEAPKLFLCIEDDEDDYTFIEEAAAEIDPRLVFVNKPDGREALMFLHRQKAHNRLPCLILLDINMPVMDGKETLAAIKADPELGQIPLIVFSTSTNMEDRLFCEKYGAELITKPQKLAEFKKVVQHIVLSRCA